MASLAVARSLTAVAFSRLKCNRLTPCDNCIKRGDTSSCSYANSVSRRKTQTRASPLNTPDDMQHRIDRLEGLVLSLMTNGSEAAGPMAADRTLSMSMGSSSNPQEYTPQSQDDQFSADQDDEVESESDRVSSRLGVLHINNNKAMYIGDAHWASILNDVSNRTNTLT